MTYQVIVAQGSAALVTAVEAAIAADSTLAPLGGVHQLGSQWSQALSSSAAGSSSSGSTYTLPVATATTLGGVMIGDNLTVDSTGKLSGAAAYTLPAATTTVIGGVMMAANQANAGSSSATDVTTLVTDFNTLATKYNALLAALQAAGIMAASS